MLLKIKKILKRKNKRDLKANKFEVPYYGINSEIEGNNRIFQSSFGKNTYYTYNTIIYNSSFGNYCSIGPNSVIGFGNHPVSQLSTSPAVYYNDFLFTKNEIELRENDNYSRVIIGHDVWIGANVFIKNGVKIGNGAVVGAGSIVLRDIKDFEIVVGNPAIVKRTRFSQEIISLINQLAWWNLDENDLTVIKPIIENPTKEGIKTIIENLKKSEQ